ncbi:hypothetical protein D3C75_817140 [compost metagenome]
MAAFRASRLVCSAMARMVPRIWLILRLPASSSIMDCDDSVRRRPRRFTLSVVISICCLPSATRRCPFSADSAAPLHERATSLAVATISLNAVDTNSTASRCLPAASFMLLATSLLTFEAFCRLLDAAPMCWIN